MGDFKRLLVWRRSHAVALAVYRLTATFPPAERFGLVSQMRRAATSISANIAEGAGRYTLREQARFYQIAKGSAKELECHLVLACDLGFLSADATTDASRDLIQVQRMLSAIIRNAEPTRS